MKVSFPTTKLTILCIHEPVSPVVIHDRPPLNVEPRFILGICGIQLSMQHLCSEIFLNDNDNN